MDGSTFGPLVTFHNDEIAPKAMADTAVEVLIRICGREIQGIKGSQVISETNRLLRGMIASISNPRIIQGLIDLGFVVADDFRTDPYLNPNAKILGSDIAPRHYVMRAAIACAEGRYGEGGLKIRHPYMQPGWISLSS